MRSKLLPALILIFVMMTIATAARGQKGLPCGNEADVARARAQALEAAAASCRQDLAHGHDSCDIRVEWRDLSRYSAVFDAQQAETLAARLREFARAIDAFDKELQEARSHYEVNNPQGTYVTAGRLRCSQDTSVTLMGDRVSQCKMDCYRKYGLPYLDCWRGDFREMPLCMFNEGLRFAACNKNCAQP